MRLRARPASTPPRYPTTPEGYLALSEPLDAKQKQVLQILVQRARQRQAKAEQRLLAHQRPHRVIPLAQQVAMDAAIGLRRSLIGLCLLLGPATGAILWGLGQGAWGLGVGVLGVGLALGLRALNQVRMRQGELEPDELKAMAKAAQPDPVARRVWLAWRKDGHLFSQYDYEVMGHYLGCKDLVQQWQRVAALARGR